MSPAQLSEAVAINAKDNGGAVKLEASGNVNIDTVREIAETGVDYISTSKITMARPDARSWPRYRNRMTAQQLVI